jgi:hypothetical protein
MNDAGVKERDYGLEDYPGARTNSEFIDTDAFKLINYRGSPLAAAADTKSGGALICIYLASGVRMQVSSRAHFDKGFSR